MDRRNFERFEIGMPSRLEAVFAYKKKVFDVITRDISASGAFVSTNSPFSEGLSIKMTITNQNERISELTGSHSLIECEGYIVRTTPTGVGICFDKDCQIVSLMG